MSDNQRPRTPNPIVDDHLSKFNVGSGLVVSNPFAPGKNVVIHNPSMRLPPNMTLGEYVARDNPTPSPRLPKPFKPLDDPSSFMNEEEFERERDRQEFGRQYIHKYKDYAREYYGWIPDEIVTDDAKYQEALSTYNTEYEATRVIREVERKADQLSAWNRKHKRDVSNTTRTISGDYMQQDAFSEGGVDFHNQRGNFNLPMHANQHYLHTGGVYSTTSNPNQAQFNQQLPLQDLNHATHSGFNPHYQIGFPSHRFATQNPISNEFQGPYIGSLALSRLPPAPTELVQHADTEKVPEHGNLPLFKFPATNEEIHPLYNNGHPHDCTCTDCEPWRLTPNSVSQMPSTVGRSGDKKLEDGKAPKRGTPREYTGSSHFRKFQADFAVAFDRYIQKHGHSRQTSIAIFEEIAKDPIFKNYPEGTSDSLGNVGPSYRLPVGYGRYKYQERGRLFGLFSESADMPSERPNKSNNPDVVHKHDSKEFSKLDRQILPGRDNVQLLNVVEQYKYEMEPTSQEEKPSLDAFGRRVPSIDESLADFSRYMVRKNKKLQEMQNKKKLGESQEAETQSTTNSDEPYSMDRPLFGNLLESTIFPGLVSPNFERNLPVQTRTPSRPPGLASPVKSNVDAMPVISYPPSDSDRQGLQPVYPPTVNPSQFESSQIFSQGSYHYIHQAGPLQSIQPSYMHQNGWSNVTVTQGYPTFHNFADYNAYNTQANSLFAYPPVDYGSIMEHSRQQINPQQPGHFMHTNRTNENCSMSNRGRRRQRSENKGRSEHPSIGPSLSTRDSSTHTYSTAREPEGGSGQLPH